MTLGKIFIVVLLAVVIGGIIIKYFGKEIFRIFLFIFLIPVLILAVLLTPVEKFLTKFIHTEKNCEKSIVRNYDEIFFKANSRKKVKQAIRKIENYNKQLQKINEKRRKKENLKFLKSVKWAL